MENQEAATTAAAQAEQVTPETTNGSLIDFILSYGTEIIEQKEPYGTYVHTIRRIGKIQEAPEQLNLF